MLQGTDVRVGDVGWRIYENKAVSYILPHFNQHPHKTVYYFKGCSYCEFSEQLNGMHVSYVCDLAAMKVCKQYAMSPHCQFETTEMEITFVTV